jgi:hypothetical protein
MRDTNLLRIEILRLRLELILAKLDAATEKLRRTL